MTNQYNNITNNTCDCIDTFSWNPVNQICEIQCYLINGTINTNNSNINKC